jgi:hypothetical protein
MSDEKLTPERAVRLLRAKAGELEDRFDRMRQAGASEFAYIDFTYITADIALIAQIVADHIEANQTVRISGPEASGTKFSPEANITQEMLDSKRPGYLDSILEVTEFDVGSKEEADYVAALKAECDAYLGRRWGPDHPDYDEMGQ